MKRPIDLSLANIKESSNKLIQFGFDIQTPTRMFFFSATTKEERNEWIEACLEVIAMLN